jgi:prepilin-type N-terminal cleavage/methylation domain-containing protein
MKTTNRIRMMGWHGFTLIELLVVIAIVAILLAVMVPALGRAKQITRVVICRSHLKNIASANQMYLDDNNGFFFQEVNASLRFGGWDGKHFQGLSRPFNPYLGLPLVGATAQDAKVFQCPDDNGRKTPSGAVYYNDVGNSYQANILLIGQDQVQGFDQPLLDELNKRLCRLNINRVGHPSQLVLAGDSDWAAQWQWVEGQEEGTAWHYRPGQFCVAFLDGHVEYIPILKGVMCGQGYCVLPFTELCRLAPRPTEP